ncbi:hypothetical protein [Dactylosporangium darangshiense]|uniref:hypothetical protein n=1 Tax=Dactylosporangium darangshiense TaxID=579108 RepID=UPI003630BB28
MLVAVAGIGIGLFGRWLGRRLPMSWAHRGWLSETSSAVVAPLLLGALFLAVDRLATPDVQDAPGITTYLPPDVVPAALVWAVVVVAVAVTVVRLTGRRPEPATEGKPAGGHEPDRPKKRRRPALAWLVSVGGGALALSLAGIVAGARTASRVGLDLTSAPLWTPQALLFPHGSGPAYGPRSQGWVASDEVVGFVASTVRPLLLATVLAIAYAAVARSRPARATVRLPNVDAAGIAQPGTVRLPAADTASIALRGPAQLPDADTAGITRPGLARLPLAIAASGVLLWAYMLTLLTPHLVLLDRDQFFGQLHMQAHDNRLAALLVALLGLAAAIAARGAVVVPAAFSGLVLVTADTLIDRADLGGPTVFVATAGAGLAVLGAADWLAVRLSPTRPAPDAEPARPAPDAANRTRPAPDAVNRTRLGVAVLAAWCAPMAFANANLLYDARLIPFGLPLGVGLSAAALLLLAAASVRTLVARCTPPLVALPVLGTLLAAVAWRIPDLPLLMMVSGLAPLAVLLTVAAARWDIGRRWVWLPAAFGALVVGVPAIYLQLLPALLVGSRLMNAAGYGNPPDGMLMVPGALLSGLGLGALLATVVLRGPATEDVGASTT